MQDEMWTCLVCTMRNTLFSQQCCACSTIRGNSELSDALLQAQLQLLPIDRYNHETQDWPAAAGPSGHRREADYQAIHSKRPREDDSEFRGTSFAQKEPGNDRSKEDWEEVLGAMSAKNFGDSSMLDRRLVEAIIKKEATDILGDLVRQGANVNFICMTHEKAGRTPLFYAVALNQKLLVQKLVDLDANLQQVMSDGETPLSTAVKNQTYDGTDMVRLLLSLGADPSSIEHLHLNITMAYWVKQARLFPMDRERMDLQKPFNLQRLWRIPFWVVGQRIACRMIRDQITQFWAHPSSLRGKPLVFLLPGPPGHGKTFMSKNLAMSLVQEGDWKLVSFSDVKEASNLFGGNLANKELDGEINRFLRPRQNRPTILLLDEFEKIKNLTSMLGWGQDENIYNTFLSLFQDGFLTDHSGKAKDAGDKIDCRQTIFICMSNLGQDEIIKFAKENDRVYEKQAEPSDVSWLKAELTEKILEPLVLKHFNDISPKLKAFARRFDAIVPFVPFTKDEQLVVGDSEIRSFLADYRDPPVLIPKVAGDPNVRAVGNLIVEHTREVVESARLKYDPMEGASSLIKFARAEVATMLTVKWMDGELQRHSPLVELHGKVKKHKCWVVVIEEEKRCDVAYEQPAQKPSRKAAERNRANDEEVTSVQAMGATSAEDPSKDQAVQNFSF